MLEDRDYMRQPAYQESRLSLTVLLIIVNAACFIIKLIASSDLNHILFIQNYLALSLEGLKHGFVWQFLTYQFLHAGWLHLIFNCLAIYFFGRSVETVLGRSRFLILYLASGIIGGLVQMLFALVFQAFDLPVVGASAGACGLVAAFAFLNWYDKFTLILYFVPIVMRGRTLFWVSVGLAVIGLLTPSSGVANAAHLGGLLTGILYTRRIVKGGWPSWNFPVRRHPPREIAGRIRENKFWRANATPPVEDLSDDDFLQKEVDPILDKISAQGIHSLTARERETLEKARRKMTRS